MSNKINYTTNNNVTNIILKNFEQVKSIVYLDYLNFTTCHKSKL